MMMICFGLNPIFLYKAQMYNEKTTQAS